MNGWGRGCSVVAVIHLYATVLLENDAVFLAERHQFVPFLWFQVVRADDDFTKMMIFMNLCKVLHCSQNAEAIAVAMAEALVVGDESDDVLAPCAANVNHDGIDVHTPLRADSAEKCRDVRSRICV